MGPTRYPNATRLLVTADGGGSNGHRVRLWKVELQTLANTLSFPITVCHLPRAPANGIRSNTASFPSLPSTGAASHCEAQTIVQLIAATTTTAGLTVRAEPDESKYPKGVRISDAQFTAINLARHPFHGDWNYAISPSVK